MMGHKVDVALWQRGILLEGDQEIGPACHLFEASISAFSALLQVLGTDSVHYDSESYRSLREEFRKFYMWNEGFSTRAGDLDHVLSCSKNLKGTILSLMVQWVKAVSKIPETMSEFDWTSVFAKFTELQMITSKVEQVAKASISDMKSQYSIFDSLNSEDGSESDSDSDLESSMSEYTFEDIIEDLSTYMESLADLSPSLDHPATDNAFIEDVDASLIDEFSTVSEPAKPFVLIIRDRFPSLDAGIVKRLGEANWQRRKRLRMKLVSAPEMGESYAGDDDNSSTGDTIVDPRRQVVEDQQTMVGTARSSISVTRTFQSTTIESRFSDPSIFDNASIPVPSTSRDRRTESVTSFSTSIAGGMDYGQRRVPNLPVDHVYGSKFQCKICGDNLSKIRYPADWKKHVFTDLEPYICLFSTCDLGLHTFKSRREWSDHEFQAHRINTEWHCNLCKDIFKIQELFRRHINESHGNDIAMSQVEEIMSVSKRLLPCKIEDEICPFCQTKPSQSQGGFAIHVGKHQQEISLAALPRLEALSDDESSVDGKNSDNDDDSDDNDNNDNSRHDFGKKKGTGDAKTEKGENSAPGSANLTSRSKPKPMTSQTAALEPAVQAPVCLPFKVKSVCQNISPFKDTLQFPIEQIITVTQEEEGEWYIGEYVDASGTKQKGLFPKKFVEKYESADALLSMNSSLVVSSQAETMRSGIIPSPTGDEPNKINEKGQPDAEIATSEGRETDLNHFIAESIDASPFPFSGKKKPKYTSQPSEPENLLDIPFQQQVVPHHSYSLSQDIQQSINTTRDPQSLLMLSIQNFEMALENCEELWHYLPPGSSESLTVLASLEGQLLFLRKPNGYIASRSSNLSLSGIETLIENLAICRTQLLRLQKVLESVDRRADEAENSPRFTSQWTLSASELIEAQDILTELRVRTEMLERIYTPRSLRRTKVRLEEAGTTFKDEYDKYQPALNEQKESTAPTASTVERPILNANPIDDSSDDRVPERAILPAKLPFDNNIDEQDDDVAYPCKGCGEILEEGKAFELAGHRWHIDCFRCNTCGTLLDSDANLLLLGDGSLVCNNCTYSCSACGNKIEDLAILTGDQAFCATCFRCRNCKRKIENLRYARTTQGIFCMSCHESLMARRRKKSRAAANTKLKGGQGPSLVGRSLAPLPPLPPNAIPQSALSPSDLETPGLYINLLDADVLPKLSPKPGQDDTL